MAKIISLSTNDEKKAQMHAPVRTGICSFQGQIAPIGLFAFHNGNAGATMGKNEQKLEKSASNRHFYYRRGFKQIRALVKADRPVSH